MEDAATAEISRAQVWQWLHHGARLEDGRPVDRALFHRVRDEELARLAAKGPGRFADAGALFTRLIEDDEFAEFLTLPAYDMVD